MNELKPCPCGENPEHLHVNGGDRCKWAYVSGSCCNEWSVAFKNNHNSIPSEESMKLAVEAWNNAKRQQLIEMGGRMSEFVSSDKKNIQHVFGLIKKDPVEVDLQDSTDINMLKPKIKLYDTLRHIKTGRIGIYVEHVNCGEGYMISTDDGKIPRILAGEYNDFEILEKEKPCCEEAGENSCKQCQEIND